MNVIVLSAFRDSAGRIDTYLAQMDALQQALNAKGATLRCVWGEGDSTDNTLALLQQAAPQFNAQVLDVTCGGPRWDSIVHPERFAQLALIWNQMMDAIPADADAVMIVESDLQWDGAKLALLVEDLEQFPVVGGMVWWRKVKDVFYDIWAYRMHGKQFSPLSPYFPYSDSYYRFVKVDSLGSVVAMRGNIARQFRLPAADVLVGFCNQVRGVGGSIWIDQEVDIVHP